MRIELSLNSWQMEMELLWCSPNPPYFSVPATSIFQHNIQSVSYAVLLYLIQMMHESVRLTRFVRTNTTNRSQIEFMVTKSRWTRSARPRTVDGFEDVITLDEILDGITETWDCSIPDPANWVLRPPECILIAHGVTVECSSNLNSAGIYSYVKILFGCYWNFESTSLPWGSLNGFAWAAAQSRAVTSIEAECMAGWFE
jgi:hypothetical protein